MKYPTLFESEDIWGYGVIFQGHGWSKEYCEKMMQEWDSAMVVEEGEEMVVKEWNFRLVPRLMWCQNYDWMPCDNVGTWHPHWIPSYEKDVPETRFTVVYIKDKE